MVDAQYIRKLYERYPEMVTKGDVEGIVALYADDATIEDPIGRRSTAASTRSARSTRRPPARDDEARRPVHVAGREAATPLRVLHRRRGQPKQALDIISVMAFREDGKIASMRAFWSFDAMAARDARGLRVATGAKKPPQRGLKAPAPEVDAQSLLQRVWDQVGPIAIAVLIALLIRAMVIESYYVPSGSMLSTMFIGDHVFVSKFVFGAHVRSSARSCPPCATRSAARSPCSRSGADRTT
jgi:steroid delta-isomerase